MPLKNGVALKMARKPSKHGVARIVSIGVVDVFKVVHIEDAKRSADSSVFDIRLKLAEILLEPLTVGYPG